jgi:ubiquinone/menaquinone biosynthesis C-methylase UbiE
LTVTAWDRAARLYDFQLFLERRAIDQALELAAIRPGDRLLDLGTGTGGVLRRLAGRADAPREAVGVDRSASMLAAARDLPSAWRLVRADATALPFADESFDVVTAVYLLHLLDPPARRALIADAARVLRPGGRLITVTVVVLGQVRWRWRSRRWRRSRDGRLAPWRDWACWTHGVN